MTGYRNACWLWQQAALNIQLQDDPDYKRRLRQIEASYSVRNTNPDIFSVEKDTKMLFAWLILTPVELLIREWL